MVCQILAGIVTLPAQRALAQRTPEAGPYARIVVIAPKPGQTAAFEAGYRRHLAWHRAAQDPWTWYGWTFVLGERASLFMDGVFGLSGAELDRAVRPAEDAADNARNVWPYADLVSHSLFERLDAISMGRPLPDTSAYLGYATYRVRPGMAPHFEALLARYRAHFANDSTVRYSWFRLRIGGGAPQFVLMRAVRNWSEAAALSHFFEAARLERPAGAPALSEMLESIRSEMLRYRRDLSS